MIRQEDVGNYYIDDNNYIWQMIGWCPEPTAILMNLATKEKEHIVPNCLNALSYHKLVRENEVINLSEYQKTTKQWLESESEEE